RSTSRAAPGRGRPSASPSPSGPIRTSPACTPDEPRRQESGDRRQETQPGRVVLLCLLSPDSCLLNQEAPMTKPARGRLLVVDDEVELMTALCESLQEEGFETAGFADPAKGLEAVRAGEYDLLLSDLMMPGIDGITLLREALELDPSLVGVIMTGQGS